MLSTKRMKFKGEIENYLRNGQNQFECKIDHLFTALKVKTWLCRTSIAKKDSKTQFVYQGKALGILTHKLGRPIYYMLKDKEAFSLESLL